MGEKLINLVRQNSFIYDAENSSHMDAQKIYNYNFDVAMTWANINCVKITIEGAYARNNIVKVHYVISQSLGA